MARITFTELMAQRGYTVQTTFWEDFSIADRFGKSAVLDTFKRAFSEWKTDYKYLTEMVLVLNTKAWDLFNKGNQELSEIYSELYFKVHDYACTHLKGEEFEYYFNITD